MKFVYSPETRAAETFPLVKEATAFLAEEVIPAVDAPTVSADWTRVQTPREEMLDRLTLSSEHGQVFADFKPSELDVTRYVRATLFHLWFDLQWIELRKLRRENSQLVRELFAGGAA